MSTCSGTSDPTGCNRLPLHAAGEQQGGAQSWGPLPSSQNQGFRPYQKTWNAERLKSSNQDIPLTQDEAEVIPGAKTWDKAVPSSLPQEQDFGHLATSGAALPLHSGGAQFGLGLYSCAPALLEPAPWALWVCPVLVAGLAYAQQGA